MIRRPHLEDHSPLRVLLVYRRYTSSFIAYPWLLTRQGGMAVDVIAPHDHLIKHAKWPENKLLVRDTDEFIERLSQAVQSADYQAVLAVDEPARKLLLDAQDRPELAQYLPRIRGVDNFDVALSKNVFGTWCLEQGFRVPRFVSCKSHSEVEARLDELELPCMLKAVFGAGGQEVFLISGREDLDAVLAEHREIDEWILQEHCEGSVGTTIFVAKDGQLYGHCSYYNRVCTASGYGPAAVCEYVDSPDLADIAERMAERVDGFTGYDWILMPDGEIVLLDPHFGRVAPTGAAAHLFGVDLGEAYANSLIGGCPIQKLEPINRVVWIFPQSLQLLLEGRFTELWGPHGLFKPQTRLYLCAKGEWRMFVLQLLDYLVGMSRVYLGGLRRKIFPVRGD